MVRIKAENSNQQIMFFSKYSEKSMDLIKILLFENSSFKIEPQNLDKLISDIKNKMYGLIESDSFVEKKKGHALIIDTKKYYVDVKSHKIDRRIQTLYSLFKIARYCKVNKLGLFVDDETDME